jgi:threonine synthase
MAGQNEFVNRQIEKIKLKQHTQPSFNVRNKPTEMMTLQELYVKKEPAGSLLSASNMRFKKPKTSAGNRDLHNSSVQKPVDEQARKNSITSATSGPMGASLKTSSVLQNLEVSEPLDPKKWPVKALQMEH